MILDGGGTGSGDTTGATTVVSLSAEYDIMNLVNVTFFSINDTTASYFLNLNFDLSTDLIKAGFQFDKILSSVFKNDLIGKSEFWMFPILSIQTFKNLDVMPAFSSIKLDNSAANPVDQTVIDDMYFTNLVEWSDVDITGVLDLLLIDNIDDYTITVDQSNFLYNRFFSLN